MSTTTLPCVLLLQLDSHSGVKSGLTTYRWQALAVAFEYSKTGHTVILVQPSNACAGAKRLLAQLTPLQLCTDSRRGWPRGLQVAMVEVRSTAPPAFRQ